MSPPSSGTLCDPRPQCGWSRARSPGSVDDGCAALLMLISSAVAASAQGDVRVTATEVDVSGGPLGFAAQKLRFAAQTAEPKVSSDQVVARLMLFDRNGDGKVATAELSERMQALVTRGDRGGDGTLDDSEIRAMALKPLEFVTTAKKNSQFGGYSFGDTVGLSTRTHIENTIEDLRLASPAAEEAKRVASAFADELESTALTNLRSVVAPMLTDVQLAEFERNVKNGAGGRTIRMTSNNGGVTQTFVIGADPHLLLTRYQLTPEQTKTATTAAEIFKTEQQLDDTRRSALVARVSGVLTDEEREDFSAALARRPLVKGLGAIGNFQVLREEAIRREFPGNGVPVREIGFTSVPVAPTSR